MQCGVRYREGVACVCTWAPLYIYGASRSIVAWVTVCVCVFVCVCVCVCVYAETEEQQAALSRWEARLSGQYAGDLESALVQ